MMKTKYKRDKNMKKFKQIITESRSARIRSARTPDKSLSPYLVSTRMPKKDIENAPTGSEKLTVGMEAIGSSEIPKMAQLYKTPERGGVKVYPNIGPDILKLQDPQDVLRATQRHMERNLDWGLERAYTLPELAERSQQWYVGAHNIAKRFADKFNVPHHVAAAVLATQSPQKDWYQNVSLAERIMKIHKDHQNTGWSPEMEKISSKVFKEENPNHQSMLNEIRGKTLGELKSLKHKAAWVRAFDEAHHPRHYRLITPEGEFAEHATGSSGKRNTAAWLSFDTIEKSLHALTSNGDMKKISKSLGAGHKVRSFYNNIIQPNTPKIITPSGEDPRDVTVDTHATGNIWVRPSLAGGSEEVGDVLGGSPESSITGMSGVYPHAASAFRSVADIHGLEPNAVQSIVWDERRATNASKAQKQAVDTTWERHRAGELSQDQAQAEISKILGPAKRPSWAHTRGSSLYTSTFESIRHRASKLISESLQKRQK